MSENSSEALKSYTQHVEELSARLLEVLHGEKVALVQRSLTELDAITAEKAELCVAIDSALASLGSTPLRGQIAALPEPDRVALEPAHARLVDLAGKTQECNAVNGKIVRRSQQSVRELMHLMSGKDTDALYSEQGYTAQGQPQARSQGTAIARA
jgi:flagellar biosynthesis/type III secretory pathway chaperone